jgi:uncharacterized protein YecE (DUF72 family)
MQASQRSGTLRPSSRVTAAVYVGCAGWNLPRAGSHLERYAAVFPAVEINSSFYRPHRPATYARWAASVPADFRFSVKVPRAITHERRLKESDALLDAFLAEATALGPSLGCLLVQLPPSLTLDARAAESFLAALRARYAGAVAAEPRHASWFAPDAERLLGEYRVARVAADPARVPAAAEPGGWPGLVYYRLHGSPEMYYSAYAAAYLDALAERLTALARSDVPAWCIFDNTALGAATRNALELLERLGRG